VLLGDLSFKENQNRLNISFLIFSARLEWGLIFDGFSVSFLLLFCHIY
jgi:hypothetical protein